MSFDLAVWESKTPVTAEEAVNIYSRMCDDSVEEILPESENVKRFILELNESYPFPSVDDDLNDERFSHCPWTVEFDGSTRYSVTCIQWSRADEMYEVVLRLAKKYGLTVYNPQDDKVILPG